MSSKVIYTIGYAGFSFDEFIEELLSRNITALIDVRSVPYSKYYKKFSKEALTEGLKKYNITYMNFKEEFGARNGEVDFECFTKTPIFKKGIDRINNGVKKGYNIILMCAEKDYRKCHRKTIAEKLNEEGYDIVHIKLNIVRM
jgi:uncharacterized protein (DUF488 family)